MPEHPGSRSGSPARLRPQGSAGAIKGPQPKVRESLLQGAGLSFVLVVLNPPGTPADEIDCSLRMLMSVSNIWAVL